MCAFVGESIDFTCSDPNNSPVNVTAEDGSLVDSSVDVGDGSVTEMTFFCSQMITGDPCSGVRISLRVVVFGQCNGN